MNTTKCQINDRISMLKKSPIFAISLSGKELAHSNFWAWLIDQEIDNEHLYVRVFVPDFDEKKDYEYVKVEREKWNMDLLITYKHNNKVEICVVENKIKSLPTEKQ